MVVELAQETVWFDKWRYDDAETQYQEKLSGGLDMNTDEEYTELECQSETPLVESSAAVENTGVTVEQASSSPLNTLSSQIGQALKDIQATRQACSKGSSTATQSVPSDLINRVTKLEGEKSSLNKTVKSLEKTVAELTKRLAALECVCSGQKSAPAPKAAAVQEDEDDDDVDLFGSDDDEEEDDDAKRVREERLAAYADKKSKKAGPIAKSSVLLDCKPWDDETDMKEMERLVREIQMDGLTWGAAKTVPLAFGIEKLSILCIVEDLKVSIDDLIEKIQENEDYVQSVDIGAFNKI